MRQIVPVDGDPFAPDAEQAKPAEESKGLKGTATKLSLEVNLAKEALSAVTDLIASQQKLIEMIEQNQQIMQQNQERVMLLLETLMKPKKIKLIRDASGQATEAVSEYEKPQRLN